MAGASRRRTTKPTSRRATSPVGNVSRSIPDAVRLYLYVRAGGRCQFDGCNKYLLRHSLTRAPGNYGQMGHIIAFSARGPRGRAKIAKKHINDLSNLMLLCPECHKLVDTDPDRYSEKVLREFKKRHEARILELTGRHADALTTIFILQGNIGMQAVQISEQHLWEAIAPRYQEGDPVCVDLTSIADGENASFWDVATYNIRSGVERLYERRLNGQPTPHISVFALGPIPLLIYLGSQLSNKVPVHLFQRHRDTEDWTWKTTGDQVDYEIRTLQTGTDPARVAVVLSLSGTIQATTWPAEIDGVFTVYEVTLAGATPNPMFLRRREDLLAFNETYQRLLATILKKHPGAVEMLLLPAVPAPIAVTCGRERLPKVHPALVVYDYDKAKGGFTRTIRID